MWKLTRMRQGVRKVRQSFRTLKGKSRRPPSYCGSSRKGRGPRYSFGGSAKSCTHCFEGSTGWANVIIYLFICAGGACECVRRALRSLARTQMRDRLGRGVKMPGPAMLDQNETRQSDHLSSHHRGQAVTAGSWDLRGCLEKSGLVPERALARLTVQ
jgi:hypothetical protein